MPAVESRRGGDVAERSEVPAHMRVQEHSLEREDGSRAGDHARIESEQKQRKQLENAADRFVQRMHPRRCEPVERLRTVMNRVESPQWPAMKQAMTPIAREIATDQHLDP